MDLHPELAQALNEHLNVEASSAFMYFSLASWAEVQGLTGFAKWAKSEGNREFSHMHEFVDYLNNRGMQAIYTGIPKPVASFTNITEGVKAAYMQEKKLMEAINALVKKATEIGDYFSASFLHGFIPQQTKDVAESERLYQRVAMTEQNPQGILLLDQQLASSPGH